MAGRLFAANKIEAKNAQNPKVYQLTEKIVFVKTEFISQPQEVLFNQVVQLLNTPEDKRKDGFDDILMEVKYVEAVETPLSGHIPILLENIQEISVTEDEGTKVSVITFVNPQYRFINKTEPIVSDQVNVGETIVTRL